MLYYLTIIKRFIVKESVIQSEAELLDALRRLLVGGDSTPLRLVNLVPGNGSLDAQATFDLDGRIACFTVELKLETTAATVVQLAATAPAARTSTLLATVRLPESLARRCREAGINHVDLNGRVWIRSDGLLIDRNAPNLAAVSYRLADREVDFFSPKSCRIARVLLSHPQRNWRQADLAKTTQLSQGLVSRLLNYASKFGWVEGGRGDWRLADQNAVLDAWEKVDDWHRRVTIRQYSTYEVDLNALARRVLDRAVGEIAFTQWFAANLRFPYTQPPLVSVYRRHLPTPDELAELKLREVNDGGRLWVLVPRDEGVFQTVHRVDGFPLVCDAQIYLDLLPVGLRGPDQAKALREWEGFCKP